MSEEEARQRYETFAVPAPAAPLIQVATANLNPWTDAKADTNRPPGSRTESWAGSVDCAAARSPVNAGIKRSASSVTTSRVRTGVRRK